jgi:hypothetical protein
MIVAEIFEKIVPAKWIVCDRCSLSNRTAEIMPVLISGSASAAATGYSCKNSILPFVLSFCT